MTFGSLFAGIGGLDLGLELAGMQCVWQVEKDPYCQKVLAKHWPNIKRWDDVTTFTGEGFERPDAICGGFPCQDLSFAGTRKGINAERSGLWWEYARIIRLLRPRYVVVENVPGLLTPTESEGQAPIGWVLGELAGLGYDAEWESLPASAFGSTQLRFRVFIVAYPSGIGNGSGRLPVFPRQGRIDLEGLSESVGWSTSLGTDQEGYHPDDVSTGCEELHLPALSERAGQHYRLHDVNSDANCSISGQGVAEDGDEKRQRRTSSESSGCNSPFIGQGWWNIEPQVGRMVYGVSRRMVRGAIRGLGNCVVPQVSEYVGQCVVNHSKQWGTS